MSLEILEEIHQIEIIEDGVTLEIIEETGVVIEVAAVYQAGGGGSVESVNGQTGAVVLTIPDALADLAEDTTHRTVSDAEKSTWSGKSDLALGETNATAYRGDRGATAYAHSQATGNPHGLTKTDLALGNVDNTSDANKPVSTATQTALNLKANSASLSAVATSGAYADLSGKPSIPATLADLTSDSTHRTVTDAEKAAWNAGGGIPDAPSDGTLYARKNAAWASVPAGAGLSGRLVSTQMSQVTTADSWVVFDAVADDIITSLPQATGTDNQHYILSNLNAKRMLVTPYGSELIDGGQSITIYQGEVLEIASFGGQWRVL